MCCSEMVLQCLSNTIYKKLFGWLEQTNMPKYISLSNIYLFCFQFQHVFRIKGEHPNTVKDHFSGLLFQLQMHGHQLPV